MATKALELIRQLRRRSLRGELRKRRVFFGQAAQISGAAWISTVVAFFGTVVAARGLGATDFGDVVLATAVTAGIATLLDVTLEEALVHHGTRALARGDVGGLRALLRRSIALDATVGAAVAGLLIATAAPLADATSEGQMPAVLIQLGALQTLVATVDSTTGASLLLAGRPQLRGWMFATLSTFRLAGVVVALQVGGAEAVMVAYVIAALAASAVQCLIARRVAWRPWAAQSRVGTSPVSTRRLFRFGLHTSLSTTFAAGNSYLFPILLGRLAGVEAVGVFKVAMLPITVADTISAPFRILTLPMQARLAARGQYARLRRAMVGYTFVGLTLGLVGFVVGWFLLPKLIPFVYSASFDGAVTPARILMVAAVSHLALGWCGTFHAAIGRPAYRSTLSAMSVVLNIGLLLLLGGHGATGAAVAFSVGTVAAGLVFVVSTFNFVLKPEETVAVPQNGQAPGLSLADLDLESQVRILEETRREVESEPVRPEGTREERILREWGRDAWLDERALAVAATRTYPQAGNGTNGHGPVGA